MSNWETSELRVGTRLLEYRLLIQLNNTKLKSAHTFSYVEGSQHWFNMFDLIIRRAVYHAGLSCTQDRRTQMLYFNLPKLFRRRCELGFDLIETQTKSWQFLRHTDEKNLKQAVYTIAMVYFHNLVLRPRPLELKFHFIRQVLPIG